VFFVTLAFFLVFVPEYLRNPLQELEILESISYKSEVGQGSLFPAQPV
jgi:hypothetical protein